MSTISRTRNPLNHNGTSQYERLLEALTPAYFKIDDRSIKDLLNATYEYAQLLCYYNENNVVQGDWTCFWKVEMLTFLASTCSIDADAILRGYFEIKENFQPILANASGDDFTTEQNNFHLLLIEYLRQQALRVEDTIHYLPNDLPLKQEIIALVQKDSLTDTEQLASDLRSLIGFHKEAYYRIHDENLESEHYDRFIGNHWGVPDQDTYYNDIDHNDAYRFNSQEELDKIAKAFYQTFKKIKHRAGYWFNRNLDTPQLRQPHVALFLTFLRLFEHARNSLNDLTGKHLEFYYEKVLCLRSRGAVSDDAHLILELAATVDSHLVEKGTAFLAGQDANGKPLVFRTLEDWFLNKTQVKDIKTTYLDVNGILKDTDGNRPKRILAASDVHTAFKNGLEQPNETYEDWRPTGDNIDLPDGEIGFAIASPQLILREGKRVVDLKIKLNKDLQSLNNYCITDVNTGVVSCLYTDYLSVSLSSPKEWILLKYNPEIDFTEVDFDRGLEDASYNSRFIQEGTTSCLAIRAVLEKDHLPVDTLEDDLNSFGTDWPIIKLAIRTDADRPPAEIYYSLQAGQESLRGVKINEIEIKVDVKDIQENLIIQSDQGVFDGTQKFYPFGPIPEIGDHFYIGSTEVFQKALEDLEVEFDWIAPPLFSAHYQNYLTIDPDINLITPALRIDFIDRATGIEAAVPPRIDRTPRPAGTGISSISGQVTDVYNVGIAGAKIIVTTEVAPGLFIENEFFTNDEGFYFIQNTGSVPLLANTLLRFSYTDDYEPVPSIGEEPIRIEDSQEINVSLYPRRITESGEFNGGVNVKVSDALTGSNLTNSDIQLSSGSTIATYENIERIHQIDPFGTGLRIEHVNGGGFFNASLDPRFPRVDLNLLPFEKSVIDTGSQSVITLHLIDAQTGEKIVEGASVELLDDNDGPIDISVQEPSDFDGAYIITQTSSVVIVSKLRITYDPSNSFAGNSPYEPLLVLLNGENELSIRHFVKPVKRKIELKGTIKVFEDSGSTDDLIEGVKVKFIGTSIENDSEADGSFSLPSVPTDIATKLELSITGYEAEVDIGDVKNNSLVDLLLFPIDAGAVEASKDPTADQIDTNTIVRGQITIDNFNGDINGLGITLSSQVGGTDLNFDIETDGNFKSNPFDVPANQPTLTLTLELPGGDNTYSTLLEINADKDSIVNFPIQEPRVIGTPVPNNANGLIQGSMSILNAGSLQDQLLGYLSIILYDNNGDPITSIAPTFPNYEVQIVDYSQVQSLEFSIPNYPNLRVRISGDANIDVVFIPYQISNVISGTITDVFNETLSNVVVNTVGNEFLSEPSNSNGEFVIRIPNNVDYLPTTDRELVYSLQDFEDTNVSYDIYSIYSHLDIRMYNLLNVFPLVDDNDDEVRRTFNVNITTLSLKRDVRTQEFTQYSPTLKRGFLRLTLDKGDFLHGEYQNVLIASTIQAATDASTNASDLIQRIRELIDNTSTQSVDDSLLLAAINNAENSFDLPNPPYTPATNSIRLSYTSTQIITGEENEEIDNYYHLYPFNGYDEVPLMLPREEEEIEEDSCLPTPPPDETGELEICLVPQFNKPSFDEETAQYLANGNLYIGLQDLVPGNVISLLFQIQEGSEQNPDVLAPDIGWAYLTKDNVWKPLSKKQILKDTTNGLGRTGLVKIATPTEMSNETTLFTGGCYWLRAAVVEGVEGGTVSSSVIGMPNIVDIRAQAILVEFLNNDNELGHLAQPLPANKIKQLQISRSAVKKIEQPFTSFNGRLPEEGNMFYVRVSERLRHRDRAVTIYDYERLLLERFPKIRRAKCLNHTRPGSVNILTDAVESDVELAPGFVTVAVVPDIASRSGSAAAEPRFPQGDLKEMEAYLRSKTNLFVACEKSDDVEYQEETMPHISCRKDISRLRVVNPLYEEVRLCFKVQFKAGEDKEARRFDLDLAIKGFLAPWLFNEDHEIVFGRTLNRSRIIFFLENLSYVDAISDFLVIHCDQLIDKNEIVPTTSRSILTTVFDLFDDPDAVDHKFEVVDDICKQLAP